MVFTVCRYRPVIPEYGEAADKCDPGSLELCFDVGTEICDYGVFPCPYLQEIRLGNAGTDSEIGSAAHFFQDFRTAAIGLCRNASGIEAGPPDLPSFYQRNLETFLSGFQCGFVTSRSGSYYKYLHIIQLVLVWWRRESRPGGGQEQREGRTSECRGPLPLRPRLTSLHL